MSGTNGNANGNGRATHAELTATLAAANKEMAEVDDQLAAIERRLVGIDFEISTEVMPANQAALERLNAAQTPQQKQAAQRSLETYRQRLQELTHERTSQQQVAAELRTRRQSLYDQIGAVQQELEFLSKEAELERLDADFQALRLRVSQARDTFQEAERLCQQAEKRRDRFRQQFQAHRWEATNPGKRASVVWGSGV